MSGTQFAWNYLVLLQIIHRREATYSGLSAFILTLVACTLQLQLVNGNRRVLIFITHGFACE